jgi:hypothetical protein
VVVAPGARALDVAATERGYALAWWNWSNTPHQVAMTLVDPEGRALGKPLALTAAPTADPTVDVAKGLLAWDEIVSDAEHVFVAKLVGNRVEQRIDLGAGETPRLGAGVVLWQRPDDASIWSAPLAGGTPSRVADGHLPAAAPLGDDLTAVCFLRDTAPSAESHSDELVCGLLPSGGAFVDATRVALSPRGFYGLEVAVAGGRAGVAWQSQEQDDTGVSFASFSCADAAAAKARP